MAEELREDRPALMEFFNATVDSMGTLDHNSSKDELLTAVAVCRIVFEEQYALVQGLSEHLDKTTAMVAALRAEMTANLSNQTEAQAESSSASEKRITPKSESATSQVPDEPQHAPKPVSPDVEYELRSRFGAPQQVSPTPSSEELVGLTNDGAESLCKTTSLNADSAPSNSAASGSNSNIPGT